MKMKRFAMMALASLLAVGITAPAFAGPGDHGRGHQPGWS